MDLEGPGLRVCSHVRAISKPKNAAGIKPGLWYTTRKGKMAKIPTTSTTLCRVLPSYRYAPDEKGHSHNDLTGILRKNALRALRKRGERFRVVAAFRERRAPSGRDALPRVRTESTGVPPVVGPPNWESRHLGGDCRNVNSKPCGQGCSCRAESTLVL